MSGVTGSSCWFLSFLLLPPEGVPLLPPEGVPLLPPEGVPLLPPEGVTLLPPEGVPLLPPEGVPLLPPEGVPLFGLVTFNIILQISFESSVPSFALNNNEF